MSEVIAEFLFLSGRCLVGSCCNEQVTPHLGIVAAIRSFLLLFGAALGLGTAAVAFFLPKKMSLRHSIHSLAGQPRIEQVLQSLSKCLVSIIFFDLT